MWWCIGFRPFPPTEGQWVAVLKEAGFAHQSPTPGYRLQLSSASDDVSGNLFALKQWGNQQPLATCRSTRTGLLLSWATLGVKVNFFSSALLSVLLVIDIHPQYPRAASSPPPPCGYWQVSAASRSLTNPLPALFAVMTLHYKWIFSCQLSVHSDVRCRRPAKDNQILAEFFWLGITFLSHLKLFFISIS